MRKILIITDYFSPGFKGGGPIKSTKAICDNLKNHFDIYVLTKDRDLDDTRSYSSIAVNCWTLKDGVNIYYDSEGLKIKKIVNIVNEKKMDLIYLNSLFSNTSIKTVIAKKIGRIKTEILLAPRGELEKGALSLKKYKKKTFLTVSKLGRIYKGIDWHATNRQEKLDILKNASGKSTFVASNIGEYKKVTTDIHLINKKIGEVSLVFLSRISPKKNLLFALKTFQNIKGKVVFDIYGPAEDKEYYNECVRLSEGLPENITVNFRGEIHPSNISETFSKYHYLYFPTLGENFGHVINEALIAEIAVISSKNIPENNLSDKGIGYNLNLIEDEWVRTLQYCLELNQEEYDMIKLNLKKNIVHLNEVYKQSVSNTKSMFNEILEKKNNIL